jgi:bile acid:Na+ symporter, BASS family
MFMTIDRALNILVTITLIAMMVATGLGVRFSEIAAVAKDRRLVVRGIVANYGLVPAVTVVPLLLFRAESMVAVGFLILAVCPGAPFGPPVTTIAGGKVAFSIELMVILASASAVVSPLLLRATLALVARNGPLHVIAGRMVTTLLVSQLLPLLVGLVMRQWRANWADALQRPANLASKILNLVAVVFILAAHFRMLAHIRLIGFAGMLALLISTLAIGWILGGSDNQSRRSLPLVTSLRNVGVGLIIAAGAFAGTPAVSAVLSYGTVEVLGSLLLAMWWGRQPSAGIGIPKGAAAWVANYPSFI